ncbi:MAG: cytochrome c biogenesis protein ResB [Candidatus Hydrogenedens sp.]|nr:cytochrome c biogenesis protein ResB [Candidatus Hydrogenedens sp.]
MKGFLRFLGSYKLSVVILFFLMVIVFFGTLAQTEHGIYEIQKKYFESIFVLHWLGNYIPLPLPGGGLLMVLLLLNLFVGGVLLAPKSIKKPGMLIAHGGVILLILGGFWGEFWGDYGQITLFEGETKSTFEDTRRWEIYIWKLDKERKTPLTEWIIPQEQFSKIHGAMRRRFFSKELLFEITLMRFMKNARPRFAVPGVEQGIQGVLLEPAPSEREEELNFAGIYVEVSAREQHHLGILWGGEKQPWVFEIGDELYSMGIRHQRMELPFSVRLEKFIKEFYPKTNKPRFFASEVVYSTGGWEQRTVIRMNEPLRFQGFTLYQASWGTVNDNSTSPVYSVLAVTKNPAEQVPLYSCIIVSIGLLLHFSQKLIRFLKSSRGAHEVS